MLILRQQFPEREDLQAFDRFLLPKSSEHIDLPLDRDHHLYSKVQGPKEYRESG